MVTGMILASLVLAQVATPAANQFDFWVGSWNANGRTRTDPKTDKWTATTGKNVISKVQGGKVIEENFSMTGFTGKSWSVYDANRKVWQQTWVDSSGAYLLFEGRYAANKMVLRQVYVGPEPAVARRMVFQDITKSAFTWLWQQSSDGKTWSTIWEIKYTRAAA